MAPSTLALTLALLAAGPVAVQDGLSSRPFQPEVPTWAEPGEGPVPETASMADPAMPAAPAAPVPIDGGLGLLAAAGAAYAARRLRHRAPR